MRLSGQALDLGRERHLSALGRAIGTHDAQAGSGNGVKELTRLAEQIFAVPEEGEVVVKHPLNEPDGFIDLRRIHRGGTSGRDIRCSGSCRSPHLRPVLDGLPH